MIVRYLYDGVSSFDELRECIDEIMAPLYLEAETFFGVQGSERWNFAVYLFSDARDELVPVWREKARNHPSEGIGRSWSAGRGTSAKPL